MLTKTYFGKISEPWVIIEPIVNQHEFLICHIFSNSSGDLSQGCGFSQSFGANLLIMETEKLSKLLINCFSIIIILPGQNMQ